MFKPGDIVLQKETMINGKNAKDNKDAKLSVILFNVEIENKEYICSCPITNRKMKTNRKETNYLYIPYKILSDIKLCAIKLDRAFIYPKEEITHTGINLDNNTVIKLYNAILNMEINFNKEHYEIIKNNIKVLLNKINEEEINKLKEEKKLRKKIRNEKRKNSKNYIYEVIK